MADWLPWLSAIGLGITLLTAAAAAVAFFRATSAKATIDLQQQTIQAYEQRLNQVEAELVHYKASATTSEAENQVLRQALSGKADVQRLEDLIQSHHTESQRRWDDLEGGLSQIKGMLGSKRREGVPDGRAT